MVSLWTQVMGVAGGRQRPVQGPLERPLTAPCGLLRGRSNPPLLLSHGPSKGASAQLRGPSGSLSSASAKASETGSRPSNPIFQHRNDSQQHEDACFSPLQTWPAAKATTGPNPCASIWCSVLWGYLIFLCRWAARFLGKLLDAARLSGCSRTSLRLPRRKIDPRCL